MKNNELNVGEIIKSPVSNDIAKRLISSKKYRDDFLSGYYHFHDDGNKLIYRKWVFENINSSSNLVLEHVYTLSIYTGIYSDIFLKKSRIILAGRFMELTKISCLDYLLYERKRIPKKRFIELNTIAYKHTHNTIVKFQALFNLLVYNPANIKKIKLILQNSEYPTLFYRFANQIDLLPKDIQHEMNESLISDIKRTKFNKKIKYELISKLGS